MQGEAEFIDTFLRGANAGASILLAASLLSRWPWDWRRFFGALFVISAACYLIVTAPPPLQSALQPVYQVLRLLSVFAPVFFWWFALALFDDGFRWRWPLAAPLLLLTPLWSAHILIAHGTTAEWAARWLAHGTMTAVYAYALYVAGRTFNDDLIEGRRRFRVVFAIAVAVVGLIIVYSEAYHAGAPPYDGLALIQAGGILAMTMGFALWLLGARNAVIYGSAPTPAPEQAPGPSLRAADRPAYELLQSLMKAGAWREELSVAGLAAKVGIPEHQLRRLINTELGFRNFSAFLNSYRIEAAKAALQDPGQARKQVLQIALDLGYGSIAPFNRAFKEGTGATPTEFRKAALGDS